MAIKPRILIAGSFAAALAFAPLASEPAEASEKPQSDRQVCWAEIDSGRSLCADSPRELAAGLETIHVELRVAPGSSRQAPSGFESAHRPVRNVEVPSQRTSYILAYIFDGQNFTGKSKILTTSVTSTPCQLPQNYVYGQWTNLYFSGPIDPWDNRIRSVQTYSGCRIKLFDGTTYSGAPLGPISTGKTLGILDRRASSMRIVK